MKAKKAKKLMKIWRKLRGSITAQLAICKEQEVTILSSSSFNWWVGVEPPPHISDINLHHPDIILGVFVEGPIHKGIKKTGRAFIDLCNDTAWSLVDRDGDILLHKEIGLKAIHSGVVGPLIKKFKRKLEELV